MAEKFNLIKARKFCVDCTAKKNRPSLLVALGLVSVCVFGILFCMTYFGYFENIFPANNSDYYYVGNARPDPTHPDSYIPPTATPTITPTPTPERIEKVYKDQSRGFSITYAKSFDPYLFYYDRCINSLFDNPHKSIEYDIFMNQNADDLYVAPKILIKYVNKKADEREGYCELVQNNYDLAKIISESPQKYEKYVYILSRRYVVSQINIASDMDQMIKEIYPGYHVIDMKEKQPGMYRVSIKQYDDSKLPNFNLGMPNFGYQFYYFSGKKTAIASEPTQNGQFFYSTADGEATIDSIN